MFNSPEFSPIQEIGEDNYNSKIWNAVNGLKEHISDYVPQNNIKAAVALCAILLAGCPKPSEQTYTSPMQTPPPPTISGEATPSSPSPAQVAPKAEKQESHQLVAEKGPSNNERAVRGIKAVVSSELQKSEWTEGYQVKNINHLQESPYFVVNIALSGEGELGVEYLIKEVGHKYVIVGESDGESDDGLKRPNSISESDWTNLKESYTEGGEVINIIEHE